MFRPGPVPGRDYPYGGPPRPNGPYPGHPVGMMNVGPPLPLYPMPGRGNFHNPYSGPYVGYAPPGPPPPPPGSPPVEAPPPPPPTETGFRIVTKRIPPPPPPMPKDMVMLNKIELLASFVSRNGIQFENITRAKSAGSPEFAFLFGGERGTDAALGRDYYEWKKEYLCGFPSISTSDRPVQYQQAQHAGSFFHPKPNEAPPSPAVSDIDMEDDFSLPQSTAERNIVLSTQQAADFRSGTPATVPQQGKRLQAVAPEPLGLKKQGTEGIKGPMTENASQSTETTNTLKANMPPDRPAEKSLNILADNPGDKPADATVRKGTRRRTGFDRPFMQDVTEVTSTKVTQQEAVQREAVPPVNSDVKPATNGHEGPDIVTAALRGRTEPFVAQSLASDKRLTREGSGKVSRWEPEISIREDKLNKDMYSSPKSRAGRLNDDLTVKELEKLKSSHSRADHAVDEFGRLVKQGASDSDGEQNLFVGGKKRRRSISSRSRSRSRSRSYSPADAWRKHRSPNHSPRRWGRRSRSRSRSPRRFRSRSRSPQRWGGEGRGYSDRGGRRGGRGRDGPPPTCFDFIKGRCFRGANCRFSHQETNGADHGGRRGGGGGRGRGRKDNSEDSDRNWRGADKISDRALESSETTDADAREKALIANLKHDGSDSDDSWEDDNDKASLSVPTAIEEHPVAGKPSPSPVQELEVAKSSLVTDTDLGTLKSLPTASAPQQVTDPPASTPEPAQLSSALIKSTTQQPQQASTGPSATPVTSPPLSQLISSGTFPQQVSKLQPTTPQSKPAQVSSFLSSMVAQHQQQPQLPSLQPNISNQVQPPQVPNLSSNISGQVQPQVPSLQSNILGQGQPQGQPSQVPSLPSSKSGPVQPAVPMSITLQAQYLGYAGSNFSPHAPKFSSGPMLSQQSGYSANPPPQQYTGFSTNQSQFSTQQPNLAPLPVTSRPHPPYNSSQMSSYPPHSVNSGHSGISPQQHSYGPYANVSGPPNYPITSGPNYPPPQSSISSGFVPVPVSISNISSQGVNYLPTSSGFSSQQSGFASLPNVGVHPGMSSQQPNFPPLQSNGGHSISSQQPHFATPPGHTGNMPRLPMMGGPPAMLQNSASQNQPIRPGMSWIAHTPAVAPVPFAAPQPPPSQTPYVYPPLPGGYGMPTYSSMPQTSQVVPVSGSGEQYDPLADSLEPAPPGALDAARRKAALLSMQSSMSGTAEERWRHIGSESASLGIQTGEVVLENVSPGLPGYAGGVLDMENVSPGPASRVVMENVSPSKAGAPKAKEASYSGAQHVLGMENVSPPKEGRHWSPNLSSRTGNTGSGEVEKQLSQEQLKKKDKDGRNLVLLRNAVAEYVKELLKPTWKEGQMSKEAFKTIAKKAVDKVIGALQGHQIPKTLEKVNVYMSSSKPKIAKLVQGYVDKYVKA